MSTSFFTSSFASYLSAHAPKKFLMFLRKKLNYVYFFILAWLALVWFGERTYPYSVFQRCIWKSWESWDKDVLPTRVALIADPQIIDRHTYPGRNTIFEKVTEFVTDLYLRRNWVYINDILDSDANVFLGDLFDGGREWKDAEWSEEYKRWNKIFTKPQYKRTIMSLPGNHDIGFGDTLIYSSYERFSTYFGAPSSTHVIGNHTFVLLDTISMMNTENATVYQKPYDFINEIVAQENFEEYPRILLSHVPLYRDPALSCGPDRESKKSLPYVRGIQYQTMISPEVSETVLKSIKPVAVFSGDDHDACYVQHNYTVGDEPDQQPLHAEERTVKSISMAMGVLKPAIQLLSLHNPAKNDDLPTYQTSICYMPSPFHAYLLYFLFGGFTVSIVLIVNFLPSLVPVSVLRYLSKSHGYTALHDDDHELTENKPRRTANSFDLEDQDSHDPATLEEFKKQKQTTLYLAGRALSTRQNWKAIIVDLAIIFSTGFAFYMFLSYSIFWQ